MNTGSSSGGPFRSQTGRLTVSRLPPTPIIKSIAGRTTGEVQTREELLRGITEPERLTAPLPAETVHTGAGGRCIFAFPGDHPVAVSSYEKQLANRHNEWHFLLVTQLRCFVLKSKTMRMRLD